MLGLLRGLRPTPRPSVDNGPARHRTGCPAGRATGDGSHVHQESIDEGGARLDPDSIATPTPQTFGVASPPDPQTGFGVDPPAALTRSGADHALHTGPYPSGLSRLWTYGASDSGSSRTPSHHCLPDPDRLTVPTRPVRCQGCSHHRVRSHVPSGRTGGLLRRSPLRTARAAFTASSSSKPRGRLRCVVLCSCAGERGVRFGRKRGQGGFGHRPAGLGRP